MPVAGACPPVTPFSSDPASTKDHESLQTSSTYVPSYACSNMRVRLLSLFVLPLLAFASMDEQMVLPSSQVGSGEPFAPVTHSGKPSLADLLTIDTSASIFYSYARELQLSEKFSESDEHITLLVPTNKAVIALPRKP